MSGVVLLGRCGLERLAEPLRRTTGVPVTVGAWTQTDLVASHDPDLVYVDLFDIDRIGPLTAAAMAGRPLPDVELAPLDAVVAALDGFAVVYRGLRRPSGGAFGLIDRHRELDRALRRLASVVEGQRVLDVARLWARHGVALDDGVYGLGHGEPGPGGVELEAGWIHALLVSRTGPAVKCIVVDLDDTLIHGELLDQGFHVRNPAYLPTGELAVAAPIAGWWRLRRGLHEALRACQRRGIVLALATRNDAATVTDRFVKRGPSASGDAGMWESGYAGLDVENREAAFAAHAEMLDALALGPNDFVCIEAGPAPKSTACRRIAQRLGIGLDSIAFLDDRAVEREEVRMHAPEVRILDGSPEDWRPHLLHGPGFVTWDQPSVDRSVSYRSRTAIVDAPDPTEFLLSLEIQATVRVARSSDRPRVRELLARVHQLDLNGERPAPESVDRIYVAEVRDRIADHGLVMAALVVDRRLACFVCSCRVLPHRVAPSLLSTVMAAEPGLIVERVPTERNGATVDLVTDALGGVAAWVTISS